MFGCHSSELIEAAVVQEQKEIQTFRSCHWYGYLNPSYKIICWQLFMSAMVQIYAWWNLTDLSRITTVMSITQ